MSMLQPSFAFEMLHRASGRTKGRQHGIVVWIAQLSPEKLYWVLADKNEIVTVSETMRDLWKMALTSRSSHITNIK